MSFFDYRRGKTEHEAHTHLAIKQSKGKFLPFKAPNSKVEAVIAHKP
jgi:hypothetical protein